MERKMEDEWKQLNVDLGERSYPILIGPGITQSLSVHLQDLNIHPSQKLVIITDEHVAHLYADQLIRLLKQDDYHTYLYQVPAGERSKSIQEYDRIMTYLIENHFDRNSVILAFGGGVVGDLAGFVASTFMRGIPFIQLPTTILAHDSSVGGKVAINHPLGKNMIGSFYQPLAVLYDTDYLRTLPEREIRSGLAELVKHGFIRDADFTAWIERNVEQLLALDSASLTHALYRGCQIKAEVVSQDERESGKRALLNFGHTFGHALETMGKYKTFTHGEAISIGMVLAASLSEYVYEQKDLVCRVRNLLDRLQLPTSVPEDWDAEEILAHMFRDKKVLNGKLNLVLLKQIGAAAIEPDVSSELVRMVLRKGRA